MRTITNKLRPLCLAALMAAIVIPSEAFAQDRHHQSQSHDRTRTTTRQRTRNGSWQRTRTSSTWRNGSTTINNYRYRTTTGWSGAPPVRGHRYYSRDWRRFRPDWNGSLYFYNDAYFYDPDYYYPAYVDNEWRDIAAIAGGVALIGALEDDDTLFFAGTAGALYSLYRYDQDRDSDDRMSRLRAAYFSRPYFWRDGVRYDRTLVTRNGERYYRFVRHGY